MYITFTGAARSVTGSCTLIETEGKKILVDCGMRQGQDAKNTPVKDGFVFNAAEIDVVFLTHAHIDHSGFIPLLVKKGFSGKVYCTGATAKLCTIMFPDAGHIQEMEVEWQNRKRRRAGKQEIEPLYNVADAQKAIPHLSPMEYENKKTVMDGVAVQFIDAGHLLGSSSVELYITENGNTKKLVFSGDIGNKDKPIIKDPVYIDDADLVFMESTYGDRLHKDVLPTREQLKNALTEALARGGNIVIPSFAVGRTQEVLYDIGVLLEENAVPGLENVPVYMDSPLGIAATEIFRSCRQGYYDKEAMEFCAVGADCCSFDTLMIAQSVDESKAINFDERQKIIISSSGMCDAGRIKHHLKHNLWRADSTILFVGYQAIGTLGRGILNGEKRVKIFGENINVNAAIMQLEGFSGHADKEGLLEWIEHFPKTVQKVFVMHGENDVSVKFAEDLKTLGYNAVAPKLLDTFDTMALDEMPVQEVVIEEETRLPDLVTELKMRLEGSTADQTEQMRQDLSALLKKWDAELE